MPDPAAAADRAEEDAQSALAALDAAERALLVLARAWLDDLPPIWLKPGSRERFLELVAEAAGDLLSEERKERRESLEEAEAVLEQAERPGRPVW